MITSLDCSFTYWNSTSSSNLVDEFVQTSVEGSLVNRILLVIVSELAGNKDGLGSFILGDQTEDCLHVGAV